MNDDLVIYDDESRFRSLEAYHRAREAEARLELARLQADQRANQRDEMERTAYEVVEFAGAVAPAVLTIGACILVGSLFSRRKE